MVAALHRSLALKGTVDQEQLYEAGACGKMTFSPTLGMLNASKVGDGHAYGRRSVI